MDPPAILPRTSLADPAAAQGAARGVIEITSTTARGPLGTAYRRALGLLHSATTARLDREDAEDAVLQPSLGELLSTLQQSGERELADRILSRLLATQRADGSWAASSARSAARETGDALRGLLEALPSRPSLEATIRRASGWCLEPEHARGSGSGDPTAALAMAAALHAAGTTLEDSRLREAAQAMEPPRSSVWRAAIRAASTLADLSPHAHEDRLGLLLDLGRHEPVERSLADAERAQRTDGAVPAGRGARGSCPRCMAQLVAAWYRVGKRVPADQALAYLLAHQGDSGALPDRVESAATPRRDSAAATRELLDAIRWHIATAFANQVGGFEDHIRPGDGRFGFLLREAGPLAGRQVLDAGCGRGALARALLTAYPSTVLTAMDLSPEMLAHAPEGVTRRRGSIQSLPFEDGTFDVVYCVEALEHACNPEGAVGELCRVVRPGGRVLVVDKNAERAGALTIEAWESWFDRKEVEGWLGKPCGEVRSTPLLHCPELGPELFIGWRGTRSRG